MLLLLSQDNVDIACQVVEKIAMDRAVVEIDEALASAYEVRRAHAEVRLINLSRFTPLPNHISTEWPSHSGIQPPPDLISLKHCPNR